MRSGSNVRPARFSGVQTGDVTDVPSDIDCPAIALRTEIGGQKVVVLGHKCFVTWPSAGPIPVRATARRPGRGAEFFGRAEQETAISQEPPRSKTHLFAEIFRPTLSKRSWPAFAFARSPRSLSPMNCGIRT